MVTTLILMLATCAGTLSEPSWIYMSVTVGSSAVLPCDWRNKTSSWPTGETLHIQWCSVFQTILERRGEELFQGEGYEHRVDVPEDKLLSGDCSLVLRNISTSDAGLYESYLLQKFRHSRRVSLQSVELSVEESRQEVRTALIDTSSQAGVIHPPLLILKLILLSHMLFYIV